MTTDLQKYFNNSSCLSVLSLKKWQLFRVEFQLCHSARKNCNKKTASNLLLQKIIFHCNACRVLYNDHQNVLPSNSIQCFIFTIFLLLLLLLLVVDLFETSKKWVYFIIRIVAFTPHFIVKVTFLLFVLAIMSQHCMSKSRTT